MIFYDGHDSGHSKPWLGLWYCVAEAVVILMSECETACDAGGMLFRV